MKDFKFVCYTIIYRQSGLNKTKNKAKFTVIKHCKIKTKNAEKRGFSSTVIFGIIIFAQCACAGN